MRSHQLSAISYQLVIILFSIALPGCGGSPPEPVTEAVSADPPAAPKPVRDLPVAILPGGRPLTLELAMTQDEIGQGLMFRSSLPENRGMLFLFGEERIPSFWMKNTLMPLDIVFLSAEGTVVDVIHNALPCTTEPCPQYVSKAPAMAVLEVAAGVAESHGLDNGTRLHFKRVPGFPREVQP